MKIYRNLYAAYEEFNEDADYGKFESKVNAIQKQVESLLNTFKSGTDEDKLALAKYMHYLTTNVLDMELRLLKKLKFPSGVTTSVKKALNIMDDLSEGMENVTVNNTEEADE